MQRPYTMCGEQCLVMTSACPLSWARDIVASLSWSLGGRSLIDDIPKAKIFFNLFPLESSEADNCQEWMAGIQLCQLRLVEVLKFVSICAQLQEPHTNPSWCRRLQTTNDTTHIVFTCHVVLEKKTRSKALAQSCWISKSSRKCLWAFWHGHLGTWKPLLIFHLGLDLTAFERLWELLCGRLPRSSRTSSLGFGMRSRFPPVSSAFRTL